MIAALREHHAYVRGHGSPSTQSEKMLSFARVTVRLQDGKVIEHEVQDFPGLASHPFTWEDSVGKFDRLVAGRVDEALCGEIKDAVGSLENIQVADLMKLLGPLKGR
jgi:2-methylcitrate dehydratase